MDDDIVFEKLKSQSITTLYEALVYVRTKYLKQPNGTINFSRKDGIRAVITLAEKPKLADVALSILANCCLVDEVRKEVLKYNGITTLIRILRCLASETVQNRACRALSNLAIDAACAKAIHEGKAIPIIVSFLQNSKDYDCQQTAVRALRILGNTNEHRNDIVYHEGVLPVAELLSSENISLKRCSVKAIAWLSQHCTAECAQQIQEAEGINALVKLSSDSESEVCECALTSLANLASQSLIRPEIGASGAISIFITNIECPQYRNPGINVLITALCLCCQESVNRVRIRESGGLKTLLNLMKEDKSSTVYEQIIRSLLAFRFDEPSLNVLLENDLISILIKHLKMYIEQNKKSHLFLPSTLESLVHSPKKEDSEDSKDPDMHHIDITDEQKQNVNPAKASYGTANSEHTHKDACSDILGLKENLNEECNDSDADNEVASFTDTIQKSNSSSKVFCIHSPSYQEIQNEHYESTEYGAADVCFGDICSPGSISSYCFSPDRHSMDWSIPSPPSPYGMWSPATSSRDDAQWSPILFTSIVPPVSPRKNVEYVSFSIPSSPSSTSSTSQSPQPTSQVLRYSPVCDDHGSEEETNPSTEQPRFVSEHQMIDSTLSVQNETSSRQSRSHSEHIRKLDAIYSNSLNKSADGFITPASPERIKKRRMSASSDASTLSNSHKEDHQQHSLGDYILLHMSHLSQMEKPMPKLATEECIETLLNYINFIPKSTSRAERILLRLTSNYYSFENLISFGITVLLERKLIGQHSLDICDKCSHLNKFYNKLQQNLSVLAESRYGMGELCHMLLTGQPSERSACILAVSNLIRRKNLLQRLLIDCYGLEVLMELLRKGENFFEDAVRGLSSLCHQFVRISYPVPEQRDTNMQSEMLSIENKKSECKYFADYCHFDVHFILNGGIEIGARKSQLAEQSTYFYTMFEGSFVESTKTSIPLPDISAKTLNIILHHLYGCGNSCFMLNTLLTDVLLEIITVADKLLLKDLENHVIKEVVSKLSPSMVCEVYLYSKKYDCTELHDAALRYLLVGNMKTEERCSCISTIFSALDTAANDVETFIKSRFPESREYPPYKRQRTDTESSKLDECVV